ncbi:protein scribble homolog isoform X5 [Lagopus leucura]|uniref:protein scribble homolog isoform X5 n=1 Tax=Lagopus leucura TaxID=30410 RepID=UPI001C67F1C4|nr:protein scribble homolog isoform X5 [Lagopus leucura]
MTVLRERMVEPENAITVTPLRPEDDYSPRERRGGLRFPERPEGAPPTERYSTCLMRNEKGLGFSIAGGKGSTPYRAGDTGIFISRIAEGGAAHRDGILHVGDRVISINGVDMTEARHDQAVALLTASSPTIVLLVEREAAEQPGEGDAPGAPWVRMHSPPPPPSHGESPPEEMPSLQRSQLSKGLEDQYPIEEIHLVKAGGPLGLSIVGGSDHSSHPFGIHEPGVFISKVIPRGLASRSGLRVGDRILEVNSIDLRHATHQEAVNALLSNTQELSVLVRRDPPPPGMQEICIEKAPGEKLGISIRGGAKGHAGNPFDPTDEGIFISKMSPGIIANPFAAGIGRKNSLESISSIDRDLSPEELEVLQKEMEMVREATQWEREEMEKVEWMRREREAATRQLEEAAENVTSEPLRMDYRTLAALPSSGSQRVNRTPVHCDRATSGTGTDHTMLSLPVAQDGQDCSPAAAAAAAAAASLTTRCEPGPPQDPASPCRRTCGAEKPPVDERDPNHCSPPREPEAPEQECMIDSQPILFSENPFVVANRRGKAAGKACLGGPPLGYGREGVLKTNLYSKVPESGTGNSRRETPYSPSNQQVRLHVRQAMGRRQVCFQGRTGQQGRGS